MSNQTDTSAAILYVTGNAEKFRQAQTTCQEFDIQLEQDRMEAVEIQAESGAPIALDKATKAFVHFQKPVVISDDSWSIPALKGFPGPYMSWVNDWFTIEDWLNLTRPLKDRRIILTQFVVYQDADTQKIFYKTLEGVLLTEPRGKTVYPHSLLVSFDGGKTTNAEFHARGESATAHLPNVWRDFAEWHGNQHAG